MKLVVTAAAAALALTAVAGAAQAETYGNIGYTHVTGDTGGSGDLSLGAVTVRGGWKQDAGVFGVEAEGSFGVKDDTVTVGATPVDVKLKHQIAAYGVVSFPASEQFSLFARLGYGVVKIEGSAGAVTVGASDQSVNYGVGATYAFDGVNGLRFDYTRLDFNDGGDADTFGLAFVRKF